MVLVPPWQVPTWAMKPVAEYFQPYRYLRIKIMDFHSYEIRVFHG